VIANAMKPKTQLKNDRTIEQIAGTSFDLKN